MKVQNKGEATVGKTVEEQTSGVWRTSSVMGTHQTDLINDFAGSNKGISPWKVQ